MKNFHAIALCSVTMIFSGCMGVSRHGYKLPPGKPSAEVLGRPIVVQYQRHYSTNDVEILGSIHAYWPDHDESYDLGVFCDDGRILDADVVNITNQVYLNQFTQYHASAQFLRFKDRAMARNLVSDPQYAPDVVDMRIAVESGELGYPPLYWGLINGYPALAAFERSPLGQLEETALDGNADAQLSIGLDYESGHGVPQSYDSAMKWFQLAANRGNPIAQDKLASYYLYGWVIDTDYIKAEALLEQAAQQGYPPAQYNLAYMYENGLGIPTNKVEAVTWYRRAAQQAYPDAMMNLGICYRNGDGVPRDPLIAYMWMDCADRLAEQFPDEQAKARIHGTLDDLKHNLTPDQIKQGDLLANQWFDNFQKAHSN